MDIRLVIAPVIAQALMTLCILFVMAFRRFRAFKAKEVQVIDAAASQISWPAAAWIAHIQLFGKTTIRMKMCRKYARLFNGL